MYEDSQLAARFAALAPEPLTEDWEDVLGRAGAARKSWWRLEGSRPIQHPRRRLLVVFAVATLVVAVGTAAAFGIRAVFFDEGFIGVPPDGATPSTPESGELVLEYWGNPGGGPQFRAWVYADGRLIWDRYLDGRAPDGQLKTGFLEQRLTPEGVELLLSEFISTGWDPSWPPSQEPTPEQESALERLGALLVDPGSWLPASAWENREIRAYVPSRYRVCVRDLYADPQVLELSEILTMVPAAAADLIREAEFTVDETSGSVNAYCSDITTEKAQAIAKALDDAGLQRAMQGIAQWYHILYHPSFQKGVIPSRGMISFDTYLPHGEVIRDDHG